ncbi:MULTISPECIES: hypothetical protein [unclassified Streptomyces]|uniref:hypothetical protein n=1 Tax=unclassified Streptomyces TaxID=2593676 RepID=UPI00081F0FC7|nr:MULTISPECIES: hypothetical protein [unclassified Streptomyces]MYZ33736.1 hypothetical protein [Streptomyces sp. SID4917]SCF61419.1 hypothetical protein GA0115259_100177 [Streptomyces sp. MnatMP-M17]
MAEVRLAGCDGCIGSDRPGYLVSWYEDDDEMKWVWKRCPKQCTPVSRAATIERLTRERAEQEQQVAQQPAPPSAELSRPATHAHPASPRPVPAYRGRPERTTTMPARPAPARRPVPVSTSATVRRWPAVALDHTDDGWVLDIRDVPPPAGKKLTDWVAWLGTGLPLRVERLHAAGRAGDGMVCLTAPAVKALGLPAALPTTDKALAALKKKLDMAAASVGMEVSEEIGPVFHVFRRAGSAGGPKASLRVIVTPWLGQGSEKQKTTTGMTATLATLPGGQLDAHALARRIRAFVSDIGIAPGVTPATSSMLLLEAVRPRLEPYEDQEGQWKRRLREGALPGGDTTVPQAAGARHPFTRELLDRREAICEEEDFKWWARPLTDTEAVLEWAVAVDVCASYLSVTQTLPLPVGPLQHVTEPVWSTKTAGLWWCDLTGIETDPLLPHPATFHGMPPTGPGWYATPTVAYMTTEYGFDPTTITDALLPALQDEEGRPQDTAPILKEWTIRLRDAYKRVYSVLGLSDGQDPETFLSAYATHKNIDPADADRGDALVLATLYKQLYKNGIGKWMDYARKSHPDENDWLEKVVAHWSYRPELRYQIISAARIAGHRRMRKTYNKTGRAPFAANVDSYLYATEQPSPLELLTPAENGKPVAGVLRLGIAPGSSKHEASIPMNAVLEAMEAGQHPSRLVHAFTTDGTALPDAEAEENGDSQS